MRNERDSVIVGIVGMCIMLVFYSLASLVRNSIGFDHAGPSGGRPQGRCGRGLRAGRPAPPAVGIGLCPRRIQIIGKIRALIEIHVLVAGAGHQYRYPRFLHFCPWLLQNGRYIHFLSHNLPLALHPGCQVQ